MCLGMFITGWPGQRRVETLVGRGPDQVAEVVAAGVDCLADWPHGLQRFFSAEQERSALRPGRYGARKTLGPFYDWLGMMDPGPIKTTLVEAAAAFVHSDGVLGRQSHRSRLVARLDAERAFGMVDAGRLLGKRPAQVRRLVEAGVLLGDASPGRGIPAGLDPCSVERLADISRRALTLASAAAVLGIGRRHMKALAVPDVLPPVHSATACGLGNWMFDGMAVSSLVASLEAMASETSGERTVGMATATEAFRRRGMDMGCLIGLVLRGRLPVAGLDRSRSGLMRLRFGWKAVRVLCREQEASGEVLTLQAASERLGLKWQVVSHLRRVGLLGPTDGGITVASVDAFNESYVSGSYLARLAGTSPRHLARVLTLLTSR
jgi:hypothetical protein